MAVFYGDDLVAVLADLAKPGARRVPAKEAAGIVRAGWAVALGVAWWLRRVRARFDWRRYIGTEPPVELQPRRERGRIT